MSLCNFLQNNTDRDSTEEHIADFLFIDHDIWIYLTASNSTQTGYNSMKKDTTLISYSKAALIPAVSVGIDSSQKHTSKSNSKSIVKSGRTSQLENWINKWFPNFLQTIERRYSFVRQNLIKEFFLGSAFLYPFTVCIHLRNADVYYYTNQL